MNRVLQGLLTKFVLNKGRKPNTLEMILLKREAAETGINERKIINMFDRQPVDPNEPIIGGQNLKKEFISETDDEIIARLNKGNEDSLNRLKNKKDEPDDMATGGRAGYYGGGQAMVGEDLSEIGHGADALMARNMQLAPNGQATTSTGLNYLLGEDNDTVRVPYKNAGPVVLPKAKPKPNADPMVELLRVYNLYQESMPGVSQETQKYLQQDFIQKLNDAGISQEAFMTNRMQNNLAEGGPARKGFRGGGADMGAPEKAAERTSRGYGTAPDTGSRSGTNDYSTTTQNLNHFRAMSNAQQPKPSTLKNIFNTGSEVNYLKNLYKMDPIGLGISYGINKFGPSVMEKLKSLRSQAELEEDQNGIMQMAELNNMQKKMLSGSQKQLKNIMDISNEEILQNISPFNTEETPATIDDVNKFYAAEGGPARQNFRMGKRAFLKFLGSGVAGIAGLKTGLLGFGKKEVAKSVIAPAAQAANEAAIPPYFFKLVNKIKSLGDDVTEKAATADRQVVKKYKDYELTEDVSTGEIQIMKSGQTDEAIERFAGENANEEVFMRYKPSEKILLDESNPGGGVRKTLPEYEANTSYTSNNRGNTGEILDSMDGVSDDIFKEVGEKIPEIIRKEKANGGRIGYKVGKKVIKEGVPSLIKKVNKLLGKDTVTTADTLPIPQKTLDRDMFKKADDRLNKKREMTTNEYDDFVEELGGADQLEVYNFDGTVGDGTRILKEQKAYTDDMYSQYKAEGGSKRAGGPKDPMAEAIDNASPGYSGDLKYDANVLADDLAEKRFGKEFYDLDQNQQMDLYDEAYQALAESRRVMKKMKKDNTSINDEIKKGVAEILSDTSPAALQKSIEIDNLMLEYPGMTKDLADQIASASPIMKADMIAMVKQTFKMDEMGMSGDDIIQTFKDTTRTKQATGGLASILGK